MTACLLALSGTFVALAACVIRVTWWCWLEARYWRQASHEVRVRPESGDRYWTILDWVASERPSVGALLRSWSPPDERMAAAGRRQQQRHAGPDE